MCVEINIIPAIIPSDQRRNNAFQKFKRINYDQAII